MKQRVLRQRGGRRGGGETDLCFGVPRIKTVTMTCMALVKMGRQRRRQIRLWYLPNSPTCRSALSYVIPAAHKCPHSNAPSQKKKITIRKYFLNMPKCPNTVLTALFTSLRKRKGCTCVSRRVPTADGGSQEIPGYKQPTDMAFLRGKLRRLSTVNKSWLKSVFVLHSLAYSGAVRGRF